MIDIIIIVLLIAGFIIGLKRGLILQTVRLASYLVACFVAYVYYDDLAPTLVSIIPYPLETMEHVPADLEDIFYKAIAFAALFFATKLAFSLIGHALDTIVQLPVLKQLNALGGGVLGFMEVYLVLFLVILVGMLLPVQQVQHPLNDSVLCRMIVDDTPLLSDKVKELWTQDDSV